MTRNITPVAWTTLTPFRFTVLRVALSIALFCYFSSSTFAHVPAPIAVGQYGTEPGSHRSIEWTETGLDEGHWALWDPIRPQYLITDPTAPPMGKNFRTPDDIRFTGVQPGWTASVWEYFFVSDGVGPLGGDIPVSLPIIEWHEHILEPGWEWVVPSPESRDPPLITHDGLPWDWEYVDGEPSSDPARLSVKFAAIEPGVLFVIQKQLRWSGTPENTVWGDLRLDDGSIHAHREQFFSVVEYPTVVPEPTTAALALSATFYFVGRRRF